MVNLVPDFILKRLVAGERHGRFSGAALFVDISGFTAVTESLIPYGPGGVETLVNVLDALFAPLIQAVYARGGFITTFAGDAFTVIFPEPIPTAQAAAAGWQIQQTMGDSRQTTQYGDFVFTARVGLATGEVVWDIATSADEQRALYYFQGIAIDHCSAAEHLAQAGDFVITADVYHAIQTIITAQPVSDHYRVTWLTPHLEAPQFTHQSSLPTTSLQPFLPMEVLQQTSRGEFRRVISLFVGLPEVRTSTQLAAFTQIVFDLQAQYGGLINHLDFGDKGCYLLLFWGAPLSYENDMTRALSFALELQAHSSFPLTVGITYRLAYAGFVGAPQRETYTCYSRAVNLAARFMTTAPLGEIWLDEPTAGRARHSYELEFVGERAFKGFQEKQPVYRLLERKETAELYYQGPFVGRKAELAALAQFIEPLADGRSPGLCLIWGEAGMGKSRLVHTFQMAEPLKSLAVLWAFCQADQITRHPFNPFRYWLHHYFEQSMAQSETRNKRNFTRKLDRLITKTTDPALQQELNRIRSFLGALVDLYWPDSLYAELNPQGRLENSYLALTALLQAESQRQPLILHIEDAHWLDRDSYDFLVYLLSHIADFPIALLITARPNEETTISLLPTAVSQHQLHLSPLPSREVEMMVTRLAAYPLPPEWLALINERAEGNPFFAEQMVLYLAEQKLMPPGEKSASLGAILPRDVQTLLIARLDRLAQEVKEVVQTAAVLGREFEVELLSFMLQNGPQPPVLPENLHQRLAEAEQRAIWSALSAIRYLFRHTLMHDAAYELQLLARRRALHRLAITALETVYAADLPAHYHQLAYHAAQSQDADKQRLYYRLAGETAQANFANETAVHHYTALLPLLPTPEQSQIYRELGHLAEMAGRWQEAKSYYQQAIQCAQGYDELAVAQVQADLGDLLSDQGEYTAAIMWLQRTLTIFTSLSDAQGISNTMYQLGEMAWRQGHYQEAKEHFEQSLVVSRTAGAQKQTASALSGLGIVAEMQGEYTQAVDLYREALAIYRQIGNKYGTAVMLNNLGIGLKNLGDYGQAIAQFHDSLALKREMGNHVGTAITLTNLGKVALLQGDADAARQFFQESLLLKQATGQKRGQAITLSGMSQVATLQGNYGQARGYLLQSLALYQEVQDERGLLFNLATWVVLGMKSGLPSPEIVRLGGAVEALLAQLNTTLDPEDQHLFSEAIRQAREQLGETLFRLYWAEGQLLSWEAVLALAHQMEENDE